MKTLTKIISISALLLTQAAVNAELYKWKDARGNTQYGDTPPANVNAQPVNLPKITVVDNYADQWKPLNFDTPPPQSKRESAASSGLDTKLTFLAPKSNQAIRANDGDVSAMISLQPPLKKGHQIVFSIDGKEVAKGKSRTSNFPNLSRGGHTVDVKIIDSRGKTLKNNSISFNVLRFSKLNKASTDAVKGATLQQARTYKDARQALLDN